MSKIVCSHCDEPVRVKIEIDEDETAYDIMMEISHMMTEGIFHMSDNPKIAYETMQTIRQMLRSRYRLSQEESPFHLDSEEEERGGNVHGNGTHVEGYD